MKSFMALLVALVFFAGCAFVLLSPAYRDSGVTTSAAPSTEKSTRGFSTRRRVDRPRNARVDWRRQVAPEQGVIAKVGHFLNDNLNFRALNLNVLDGMSFLFGMMGTFFTWRSYRIQKNNALIRREGSRS